MLKEIWKDIKNYEGLYQVSTYGRIKSLSKFHRTSKNHSSIGYWTKDKILKEQYDKDGYAKINLIKNNKQKRFSIHQLVAQTFISNPCNYKYINHKNEIKNDNNINNLEWCNSCYNANYGNRNEKISKNKSKKIVQFDGDGKIIRIWDSITQASKELKIQISHISSCCNKKRSKTGGYSWRFFDE